MSDFKTALFIGALAAMVSAPFVLLIAWLPLRRKAEDDEVSHAERMAVLRNTLVAIVLVGAATTGAYLVFNEEGTGGPVEATGTGGGMGVPPGMGGTTGSASLPGFPETLAGLPQTEVVSGDQASARLVTMNPGGQFPVSAAQVTTYAEGEDSVEVRVIILPSPEMAQADVDSLVSAFSSGQMVVGAPEEVGDGVYRSESPAGINYYFASGPGVWWVASADGKLAEKALEDVKALAAG